MLEFSDAIRLAKFLDKIVDRDVKWADANAMDTILMFDVLKGLIVFNNQIMTSKFKI